MKTTTAVTHALDQYVFPHFHPVLNFLLLWNKHRPNVSVNIRFYVRGSQIHLVEGSFHKHQSECTWMNFREKCAQSVLVFSVKVAIKE